jgi:hypothetical protein
MAKARRVSLFERELRVRLAPAGLDLLFDEARVLTEGQTEGERYCGSTMMTIDLARVQSRVSDDCDDGCARKVATLLADDDRARVRARRIALSEAIRTGGAIEAPQIDVRVRPQGRALHLDLNVEARVEPKVRKP